AYDDRQQGTSHDSSSERTGASDPSGNKDVEGGTVCDRLEEHSRKGGALRGGGDVSAARPAAPLYSPSAPSRTGCVQASFAMEVVVEALPAAAPPAVARVLERADQLLHLGIHVDHGQAPRQIPGRSKEREKPLHIPLIRNRTHAPNLVLISR